MLAVPPIRVNLSRFGECVELIGAGDLHWASAESSHRHWWQMFEEHPDAYYILVGDLLHSIAPEDKRWGNSALRPEFYGYEILSRLLDAEIESFTTEMLKRLGKDWIQSHIVGAISGNHPHKTIMKKIGFDPHETMCRILGIRNLGYSAFIPFVLTLDSEKKSRQIMVYAHHGFGGGSRTEGGNITSLSRHANQFDARIYFYGHTHELVVKDLSPKIVYRRGNPPWVRAEERVIALCGTFQKTLSESYLPSYAEMKGLPVRPLGYVVVKCYLEQKKVKGKKDVFIRLEKAARSFYE